MNFLRLEFKNDQFVRATGDQEDFLEWLGEEPVNFLQVQTLPVFERLELDYNLSKDKRKRQAMIYVMKSSTFLSMYSRISGKRTYSKCAAVISALLALWELEVHRKVNVVKDAFGVDRQGKWDVTYQRGFWA